MPPGSGWLIRRRASGPTSARSEVRLPPTWKGLTAGQLVRHVEALDITLMEARRLLEEAAADEAYEHAAALRDLIKGRERP